MRFFRPRLWMLLSLVALMALALAGVSWWRRTTVVAEEWEVYSSAGVPVPDGTYRGGRVRQFRKYADGHVEVVPGSFRVSGGRSSAQ